MKAANITIRQAQERVEYRLQVRSVKYSPKRHKFINQPLGVSERVLLKSFVWAVIQ